MFNPSICIHSSQLRYCCDVSHSSFPFEYYFVLSLINFWSVTQNINREAWYHQQVRYLFVRFSGNPSIAQIPSAFIQIWCNIQFCFWKGAGPSDYIKFLSTDSSVRTCTCVVRMLLSYLVTLMVFQFSFVSSNRMVESLIVENNKISEKFTNRDRCTTEL